MYEERTNIVDFGIIWKISHVKPTALFYGLFCLGVFGNWPWRSRHRGIKSAFGGIIASSVERLFSVYDGTPPQPCDFCGRAGGLSLPETSPTLACSRLTRQLSESMVGTVVLLVWATKSWMCCVGKLVP